MAMGKRRRRPKQSSMWVATQGNNLLDSVAIEAHDPPGSLPGPVAPWQAEPYKLWSLLAMLRFNANAFIQATGLLPQLWLRIEVQGHVGREGCDSIGQSIVELGKQCEAMQLPVTLSQINYIKDWVDRATPNSHWGELGRMMKELYGRIIHELESRTFLMLATEKAPYYATPLKDWTTAVAAFPSITTDVEEACKCYALNRQTACAFHLMRTLEVALRSLSTELGIVKHSPTWEAYLSAMPNAITAKFPDKSKAHAEKREYFSALEGQLRALKTAWRNPTMHQVARMYTDEQAHELIVTVRGFMREAARELKEPP